MISARRLAGEALRLLPIRSANRSNHDQRILAVARAARTPGDRLFLAKAYAEGYWATPLKTVADRYPEVPLRLADAVLADRASSIA